MSDTSEASRPWPPLSSLRHVLIGCAWVLSLASLASRVAASPETGLTTNATEVGLSFGAQTWRFTRVSNRWALAWVEVGGKPTAEPLSRGDGFWLGGGEASEFQVLTNNPNVKSVRFLLGTNSVIYSADARERLPLLRIRLDGPTAAACAFRTVAAGPVEHGAWVTRGWVATDADSSEAFIDSSNPWVFGHSSVGGADVGYAVLAVVKAHLQRNGRTEQRSGTHFKSARLARPDGSAQGLWQLRMGPEEPKEFALLFERDPGGRLSDVCEKHFAAAVDTLVDITSVPLGSYDPEKCLQVMPIRLAAPDAFIPGWGWMMDEFPKASYPFAHDAVWQQPGLLAFEGLATGRDWERNFARYLLDKTPFEGADGQSYFVRRPGGLTRWGYFATYRDGFPHLDGGTWWQADLLYRTARALNDARLRQAALDMVLHDLNVKLDLAAMTYPPCWNAIKNTAGADHRDDWFKTPGLAYCAFMAATVAFPETQDPGYLEKADRICDWFASHIAPESKLNYLQGNNMHAVFSHYLVLMFLDRYDRTRDRRFLDMARDMAWVHIMTTCTSPARDAGGRPLTGTTCVGVRGCVDYDCAPNLCQEKDLTFVHIIGPLLDHVGGPAYAKYLALHRLVLPKDSWTSAWAADLRETNLRTMYDTYARGMANLIFALSPSSDPWVAAVDKLVSKSDTNLVQQRDLVLANGTSEARASRVQIRFLQPGTYELKCDSTSLGRGTHRQLAEGLSFDVPANSMRLVTVRAVELDPPSAAPADTYDASSTYLSDLEPVATQRGTGRPEPTYRKDQGFLGGSTSRPAPISSAPSGGQDAAGLRNPAGGLISLGGKPYARGLGCAANTVLLYAINGQFERFRAVVGVDDAMAGRTNPPPSVFFTVHVDGMLRFESGPMFRDTAPHALDLDVRHARMLMLRMSCNWDDHGNSRNDYGDWAEARLVGKTRR
jgi:hypothetical protein